MTVIVQNTDNINTKLRFATSTLPCALLFVLVSALAVLVGKTLVAISIAGDAKTDN